MRIFLFLLLTFVSSLAAADFDFVVEWGAVWQQRNDVRIPNNSGTRVNFDDFDQGPFFHYRGELIWRINKKHNLRAVYAPFNVVVNGAIASDVNFSDRTFTASDKLEVNYTFNSYRLTYFYSFWGNEERQLNLGFTGKIREAKIQFRQPGQVASYDNVGFVPLLYFGYQIPLSSQWLFHLDVDAAVAGQGRAIDLALKLRRQIAENYRLGMGLRSLEGGADNDKVYTFSWFNYAVVDITGRF